MKSRQPQSKNNQLLSIIESDWAAINHYLTIDPECMFAIDSVVDVDGYLLTTNMISYAVRVGDYHSYCIMEDHARKNKMLDRFVKAIVSVQGEKFNYESYIQICDEFVRVYHEGDDDRSQKHFNTQVGGGQLRLPRHMLRLMCRLSNGNTRYTSTSVSFSDLDIPSSFSGDFSSECLVGEFDNMHGPSSKPYQTHTFSSILATKLGKDAGLSWDGGSMAMILNVNYAYCCLKGDNDTILRIAGILHQQIALRLDTLMRELNPSEVYLDVICENDCAEIRKLAQPINPTSSNVVSENKPVVSDFSPTIVKNLPQFSSFTQAYINSFRNKPKLSAQLEQLQLSDEEWKLFKKLSDGLTMDIMNIPVSIYEQVYDLETILLNFVQPDGGYLEPYTQTRFKLDQVMPARKLLAKLEPKLAELTAMRKAESSRQFLTMVEQGDYKNALQYIKANAGNPDAFNLIKNADGNGPLMLAILNGHARIAAVLLAVPRIDVSAMSGDATLLMLAAMRGYTNIVSVLRAQVNNNVVNSDGRTALMLAIQRGYLEVVKVLSIGEEIDFMVQDKYGETVESMASVYPEIAAHIQDVTRERIMNVCDRGDLGMLKKYIASYPHPDTYNFQDKDSYSPLHWAVESHKKDIVKSLLEIVGIDVNIVLGGKSVLHRARTPEMITILLSHPKIDVNLKSAENETALMEAVRKGNSGIVKCLLNDERVDLTLSVGMSVYKKSETEKLIKMCFMRAIANGKLAVLESYLKHSQATLEVILTARDEHGRAPLLVAILQGNTAMVKMLITAGFDVNVRNQFKDTVILEEGRTVSATRFGGATPLLLAAHEANADIVQLLLEHENVQVNFRDEYDETALTYAAKHGHLNIVKLLLADKRVDASQKDNYGRTAEDMADVAGHAEIAALISLHLLSVKQASVLSLSGGGSLFRQADSVLVQQGPMLSMVKK